jgi:phenylpyruvate tautomerase PptA (4-oxalocrotonate tautomerase family)
MVMPKSVPSASEDNQMPMFVCSATTGCLTPAQKMEIAQIITDIYHEETGGPRYMVQVIFHDVAPGNYYVAGEPAPANKIWIRGDTRSEKTAEQRSQMLKRIIRDVSRASGAAEEALSVVLSEIPAANMADYGRLAPAPGEDFDAWLSSLSDTLRERLRLLS